MIDTTLNQQPARSSNFARLQATLLRPRQAFEEMASEARAAWLTPMLVLTIMATLVVLVAGSLKARAAMTGEAQLPQDWQYWSPDMQNNYMRAQQATQGPVFVYVMPLIKSLVGLWLGWLLLGALLHFGSTLLGGRGSMQGALNIVAWASLPFAVRDILRIVFMLIAGHTIVSPGFSGFVSTPGFMAQLLTHLDVFLFWNLILLVIGFETADSLPRSKAVMGVLVIMILVLLAQAGLGTLGANLGGTAVQRPFF